jgi:streptogramin lyase
MEGVLVSAHQPGSTITVTVVSDEHGLYRFPASHLAPGNYDLKIRAAGYVLPQPATVAVAAGKTAHADLRLSTTDDLADQLTNGEWMLSAPGTAMQKDAVLDCSSCHTLRRIVDSYHTAAEFRSTVLPRMANYANNTFWLKPQPFKVNRGSNPWPADMADYLASINLSSGPHAWPLKTYPRLKGASTHEIITEYALPGRLIQPHDVIGTPDGTIWYSDFGQNFIGTLNPKTGQVAQIPVPAMKPGYIAGGLEIDADPAGNLWLSNMFQGGLTRYDPRTKTFTQFPVPPAAHPEYTQESMVMPTHMNVDGKVWTNNQDDHSFRRLDPKTGAWDSFGPFTYPGSTKTFNSYGVLSDKNNTLWLLDFGGAAIAHFTPATGVLKIIPTPTLNSHPRRGRVDDRTGLFWFAEFQANRIGEIDTADDSSPIKEYLLPTPFDAPYDVVADKNGTVWAGSELSDRISHLDPATGTIVDYELPDDTNIRRVWVDNTTNPVTVWVGNNHAASITRVELLP